MFCVKCGTRLADDAAFCFNCGNRVAVADPVVQPVTEPVIAEAPAPMVEPVPVPVVEPVQVVEETPVFEPIPAVEETPVVESTTVSLEKVVEPQQPVYDQRQYTMHGSFQTAQPLQPQQQQMYQNPAVQQPQQAFYNTPVQPKKKGNTSVAGMIMLVIALIASIVISVGHFADRETGMGIANIGYFAATIGLMVFCASSKKMGSILKGVSLLVVLGLNVAFAGIWAFMEAIDIIAGAKAGIDYYYAIVLLLQYVFLYIYLLVSIIRSFIGKAKPSYFTCLCGYFAILLTVAAFVIDVVSDTPSIFVFSVIPVDLGIIALIAGDIIATLRKDKKIEE